MFTMEDVIAIAKPHNDKLVAEHRLQEAESELLRLHAFIGDLQSATGCLCALMEMDMQDGAVRATPTRTGAVADARRLSAHGAQRRS